MRPNTGKDPKNILMPTIVQKSSCSFSSYANSSGVLVLGLVITMVTYSTSSADGVAKIPLLLAAFAANFSRAALALAA